MVLASLRDVGSGGMQDSPTLRDATAVLWDHRRVGEVFYYEWAYERPFGFAVGLHGVPGIHQFGTFRAAAEVCLPELEAVVEPLREPPAPRRDRPPPSRVAVALAIASQPRNYAGKMYLLARLLLERPRLRALAADYARESGLRAAASPKSFAADLLKLYVVQEASRQRVPGVRVDVDAHGSVLSFRSVPATDGGSNGEPAIEPPASLEHAVWEHEPGRIVNVPVWFHRRLAVSLDHDGRHEFEALVRLHAQRPQLTWRALTDLAE